MALINGIYVFIDEDGERVEQEYELSSHLWRMGRRLRTICGLSPL